MDKPPRKLDDRWWTIQPANPRGYWQSTWLRQPPDSRTHIAYHEAGHALIHLYFGCNIAHVNVLTERQRWKLRSVALRKNREVTYPDGFVSSIDDHDWMYHFLQGKSTAIEDPIRAAQELICSLAGSIAEAHYKAKWPLAKRDISQTYQQFFEVGGRSDAANAACVVAALNDDPAEQEKIIKRAQDLAQAVIRSTPGWRFIELLAAKMLTLKHGNLGHRNCARIFREAFGRSPPAYRSWDAHWPPTLPQLRVGWLPP